MKKNKIIKSVIVVVIILATYRYITELIYLIADMNLLTNQLSGRFTTLGNFLSGKSIEGSSLALRGELYLISWEVFVDSIPNFLFGVYEKAATLNIIGNHSEWLDDLALLGIFRFSFLVLFIRQAAKKLLMHTHNRISVGYVFVYIILVGFINPIMYMEVFLVMFICMYFAGTIVCVNNNHVRGKRENICPKGES